jgi:transposase InsO family protein
MHYTTRFSPKTTRAAIVAEFRNGRSVLEISRKYCVSRRTVYRWLDRQGAEARSSRPKRQPRKSLPSLEERVRTLRIETRKGPLRLALQLGIPRSTVYKILVRLGINKLAPAAEIAPAGRRYEYAEPGDLLHVDVKKLQRHGLRKRKTGRGECLHVMLDDHSRVTYTEVHPDETSATASEFLERGVTWFASLGVISKRVLTDNHPTYRSGLWRHTCQLLGMRAMRTRPRRPQTNGKCERWNRTLMEEELRAGSYPSPQARAIAIENYVRHYNSRRPHTALAGKTPFERLLKM